MAEKKTPSLSEIAAVVGCSREFICLARAGKRRIRFSWAKEIRKAFPSLPATDRTWPRGWSLEP